MGWRSAQTAAPKRANSNPKPDVSTQRFTTSPGCNQRTARRERLIKSRWRKSFWRLSLRGNGGGRALSQLGQL